MTKSDLNWHKSTWKEDYEIEFIKVRRALDDSIFECFSNCFVSWILKTDTSNTDVSAVLFYAIAIVDKEVY